MDNKLIIQDNALTTARYDMTAIEKNIMYAVMAQIEEDDSPTKYYKISINDISQYTGKRIRKEEFRASLENLLSRTIYIKKADAEELLITFISSAEYKKSGYVEIGIDSKIRPYLFSLKKNFTVFGVESAISLNSKYSKRIFEMVSQFASTGILKISVEELRSRLFILESEYLRWSSFESFILKKAKDEINESTGIELNYTLKKKFKKIVSIEFFIKKKEVNPIIVPVPKAIIVVKPIQENFSKDYDRPIERMKAFGLIESQIKAVIKKHDLKVINKMLYDMDCNKDKIFNTSAFLLKAFGI